MFVDGSADDSMDDQHQFFERVCESWSQLSHPILEKVRKRNSEAEDDIQVSSMNLPRSRFSDDSEWQVSFSAEASGNFYTVHMRGVQPQRVDWDS